jgi:hypothetical protein
LAATQCDVKSIHMTDATTIEAPPPLKRKRGKGAGRPAPEFVLSGNNLGVLGEAPKKRKGRSKYTPARGRRICDELVKGRSLYSILQDEGSPDRNQLFRWLAANPSFEHEYAHARSVGWDVLAEQQLERTRDIPADLANSRKVEVDYVKWYLSKVAHRRYGDKLDVNQQISGPGGGPVQMDLLLQNQLLTPANLAKLNEAETQAWLTALSTIPKMLQAAPSAIAGPVIEGEAIPVEVEAKSD